MRRAAPPSATKTKKRAPVPAGRRDVDSATSSKRLDSDKTGLTQRASGLSTRGWQGPYRTTR